ncbi:MAG: hypothetical protein EZS28_008880 [Streblomastix strix]|uniref:Uncharacterized protein n=1 Tax=Streblomastix strix TaxID=222440 RepID=A0A5J4WL44_9EUKA|nr:MAG: hypothetical protein EZS28_008880 [Streblomastix strix]
MATEIVEAAEGIDPDAPIIERVQDVIKRWLEKHIEELRLEKYEKDDRVKKASAGREQIVIVWNQYHQDLANKYVEFAQLQERFNVTKNRQVVAQQKETENGRATLEETNTEKDNIEFEESQLLLECKSTTICISRRDEGLQETEEVVDDSKEQIVRVNLEMI